MNSLWEDQAGRALEALDRSRRITVLTGAGVSTESGIPDFQTLDEHWPFDRSRAEVTSLSYFKERPKDFWAAYRHIFTLKTDVKPNSFHRAIAGLEKTGREVVVITQNVDGLHQQAGSTQVGELHGNLQWAYCSRNSCPERRLISELEDEEVPRCRRCRKYLRPDVCLFGEAPRLFGDAKQVCYEADLLIVAGCALEVSPVNDLPKLRELYFPERDTLWLNRSNSPAGYLFSHKLVGELGAAAEVIVRAKTLAQEASLPPLS